MGTDSNAQGRARRRADRPSGALSAIWTICGLSRAHFPGPIPGTFLDLVVQSYARQADIDRDGDGLETVVYDANGDLAHCVDGDGTEIPGKDCLCDPRIADGCSAAMKATGVRATIDGVVESYQ